MTETMTLPPIGDEGNPSKTIALPTGLPLPEGSSKSIWLETVKGDPLLDHRSPWMSDAEVVIIGSGISGATIAQTLLTMSPAPTSVVMLEARQTCSGATGRNAGHCRPDVIRGFTRYAELHGKEQALKILDNEQQTWEAVVRYVREHDVDCDFWVGDSMDTHITQEGAEAVLKNARDFEAAGGDMSRVRIVNDPVEAEKITHVKGAKLVSLSKGSTLHPWKLVAHVLRHCLELGLNLQTRTPVTAVRASSWHSASRPQWIVETPRGRINARKIIHATNGYASVLLPEIKSVIKPQPHLCNRIQSPSTTKALPGSYAVQAPPSLVSVNPQSDGSILFGGRGVNYPKYIEYLATDPTRMETNDAIDAFPAYRESVLQLCKEVFGWDIKDDVSRDKLTTWTGVQGRSADQLPWIGAVPDKPGQWMCCGHNGHGMARIFTCGPAVAKLAQGAKWSETGLPECFEVTNERIAKWGKQT